MTSTDQIKKNILNKIDSASEILVLTSKPVDPDSFGTALSVDYWLKKLGKHSEVVSVFDYKGYLPEIKNIDSVTKIDVAIFDFAKYDLIFILDAGSWSQIFDDHAQILPSKLGFDKFVGIDHHTPGEIASTLPDSFLVDIDCSCTAEVLYTYFLKPGNIEITPDIADYMYAALVSDTGGFSWLIGSHTFNFANDLFNAGADHYRLRDININPTQLGFLAWGIENTEIDLNIRSSFLSITSDKFADLTQKFGADLENIRNAYKFMVMGKIEGVDYSFILEDKKSAEGFVGISWRCRNYGSKIDTVKMITEVGALGGGHRNAGGAKYFGGIVELREKITNYIKSNL